jgi:hypothetical protein
MSLQAVDCGLGILEVCEAGAATEARDSSNKHSAKIRPYMTCFQGKVVKKKRVTSDIRRLSCLAKERREAMPSRRHVMKAMGGGLILTHTR